MTRVRITEYLDAELDDERWHCHRCNHDLGTLRRPYKEGCMVRARDPREVHFPVGSDSEFNFSFDPQWTVIVEFYCPTCATMIENEYLPPGHPITWDINLDVESLRERLAGRVPETAAADPGER